MLTRPADYPLWFRVVIIVALAFLAINLFFFIGPAAAFIRWASTSLSITEKEVVGALGALFGSFVGAGFAFYFAKLQRQKERLDDEVAAGNRALFTLYEIWNDLVQYQKEVVDEYRDRSDAWLNLSPSPYPIREHAFDVKDLSFVLHRDAPTFQQVLLEGARFRLVSHYIGRRDMLVLSEVFPKLSAAGISPGEPRPLQEIEELLGVGIVRQLKVLTDGIIKNTDEDVQSSRQAFTRLRATLMRLHPKEKFINLNP